MARSTFKVLFYVNGSKEKNGIVPIMGRVTINGTVAQFSCKQSIPKTLWDVKGNKAQIITHYQRFSDREAFVTAEMVRNAYQGIGMEYETLLKAFDRENEVFKKRVGKDRVMATYRSRVAARNYVAAFIKSFYKRNDMSMQELTPRLHQGVCRIPFNGSRVAQWNDMGKVYVAQRHRDVCPLQWADTEKPVSCFRHFLKVKNLLLDYQSLRLLKFGN